jgi:DNA-binding MarR family transcriptional regulator
VGDAASRALDETTWMGPCGPGPVDTSGEEQPPALGPLPPPPRLTPQAVTVLRALHLDPNTPRDLRYLTVHTGLPRTSIRSILSRLTRNGWTSVQPDPTDTTRAHPRHLYQLTDLGARAISHLNRDQTVTVFRWDHPTSPRIVATDAALDRVLLTTTVHGRALAVAVHDFTPTAPWPMIEVTTSPPQTPSEIPTRAPAQDPVLWYATTRHRGVLLWPDPATGIILAAYHPDVPPAPAPITFAAPDGQLRTLDGTYTQLRAHDVRAALQRWWRTHTPPDGLPCRPTPLRIPPCSR